MTSNTLPPHGSEARYKGSKTRPGCHCRTCINGWTRAGKRRELARRSGQPATIPAAAVTQHITNLQAAGMTTGQIAAAAGVNSTTISEHARGALPRIRRSRAVKILAVSADHQPHLGRVPVLATRRRVQALFAAGHGTTAIAAAAGMSPNGVLRILSESQTVVTVHTKDAITRAYQQLADKPGASHRSRNRARREGWAPPAYWDDDSFDDPSFTPATRDGWYERAAARAEDIRHLASFGISPEEIATRLDVTVHYVKDQLGGRRVPVQAQKAVAA